MLAAPRAAVLVFALLAASCCVVSGELVGPRAFMFPLEERKHSEGPRWRRHLLRDGYLPVEGSVREVGCVNGVLRTVFRLQT